MDPPDKARHDPWFCASGREQDYALRQWKRNMLFRFCGYTGIQPYHREKRSYQADKEYSFPDLQFQAHFDIFASLHPNYFIDITVYIVFCVYLLVIYCGCS